MSAARDSVPLIKSADRTIAIIETVAAGGRRLALGDLADRLGYPKSSLHGLLRTLQARNWLSTDETGQLYGLGVRALLPGAAYLAADEVVAASDGVLDWLSEQLGETVHLGCLEGAEIVYVAKRESTHPLRLVSAVGVRLPAHVTALGKMLLSELSRDDVDDVLPTVLAPRTTRSITDRDVLHAELEIVRCDGFAEDRGESTEGVHCFAVKVDHAHPARYAISCSVPMARLTAEHQDRVRSSLLEAHRRLAVGMGRTPSGGR